MNPNCMEKQRFTVLSPKAVRELEKRRVVWDLAGEHLCRYFNVLSSIRENLASVFTRDEMGLMLDACCSVFFESLTLHLFHSEIEDAIALEYLDKKWDVDGEALLAKLKEVGPVGYTAIVDAIETWWKLVGEGHQLDPGDLFKIS